MEKMIFETNAYNGVYTDEGETTYYLTDISADVNTHDLDWIKNSLAEDWDLDNFKHMPTEEFEQMTGDCYTFEEWIERLEEDLQEWD